MNTRSRGQPSHSLHPELERDLRRVRKASLFNPLERIPEETIMNDNGDDGRDGSVQGDGGNPRVGRENPVLVRDFGNPNSYSMSGGIRVPPNPANYQIHPNYINLVKSDQFSGRRDECPLEHLDKFMEDVGGAITNQVTPEHVYMTLFRHSIKGAAKSWLNDLTPESLTTWDEVVAEFLKKFYPEWKTAEARRNIANFEQAGDESLGEARERFRYMLRRCPHHGFDTGLKVRFFYDGLSPISKQHLDSAAGGLINRVPLHEAEAIIDDICRNFSWDSRRKQNVSKGVRFEDEVSLKNLVQESVEKALSKKSDRSVNAASSGSFSCEICGGTNHDRTYCGGADFEKVAAAGYLDPPYDNNYKRGSSSGWRQDNNQGGRGNSWGQEHHGDRGYQGNYWKSGYQGNQGREDHREPHHHHQQQTYQSNDNQGGNHGSFNRNFGRGGIYQHPNSRNNNQHQQQPYPSQQPIQQPPPQQQDPMGLLLQQMERLNQNFEKQQNKIEQLERHSKESTQHVKMLETQLAQVASERATSSSAPLPAQPHPNPSNDYHHPVKAITLRSGHSYEGPDVREKESRDERRNDEGTLVEGGRKKKKSEEEERKSLEEHEKQESAKDEGENKEEREGKREKRESGKKGERKLSEMEYNPKYEPAPPYPHRLVERKLGDKFTKFLEMMKGLQINMPFLEAIAQMPTYAKFLKSLLSNKAKLEEAELIALPHQVSAIIQKSLPQKQADPGSFTLPVRIGDLEPKGALADLGAGVSLMPLSIARQLTFELSPTRKTIQLADRSIRVPSGQLLDIPIRVGSLVVPCDFIVIDMEPDPITPLILGREALKTLGAVINCKDNTIVLDVAGERVTFEFSRLIRQPMVEKRGVCRLNVVEEELAKEVERVGMNDKNEFDDGWLDDANDGMLVEDFPPHL